MPNYPRTEAYLASLPNGLDSYPDYVCKGSVVRQSFEILPKSTFPMPYPAGIGAWFDAPPHVTEWVPETRSNTLFLAIADVCRDEAEFFEKFLAMNRALLRGPLYRILMMVVSPAVLLRKAEPRWAAFHRGIRIHVREVAKNEATITMEYPTKLMPPLVTRVYTTAFQAACEAAGGRDVSFEPKSVEDTRAEFQGRWR